MVSAKIADQMGFDALYATGFGIVASYLGLPDAGLATYTDMVGRVRQISKGVSTPVIADADTGYGGLLNVDFTVKGYEEAGAQAIQIEDQEYPKKCGHTPGRRVVDFDDAVSRVRVAVQARTSRETLIIARTDARAPLGIDEALRRGDAFLRAGADVIFIEAPESIEEIELIAKSFDVPLMVNMVEGGRTPMLGVNDLEGLGYKIVIFPVSALLVMSSALRSLYSALLATGSTRECNVGAKEFADVLRLMDFDRVRAFDRLHVK
jgi:2-methylisocitrate lyase-like PEP mutase family enzyme